MTHEEHARKVLAQLWGVKEVEGDYEEISIIAAALKKQREADAKLVEGWHYKKGGYTELAYRIRQNEVEE